MVDEVDGIGIKMENNADAVVDKLYAVVVAVIESAWIVIFISASDGFNADVLDAFVNKRKSLSV